MVKFIKDLWKEDKALIVFIAFIVSILVWGVNSNDTEKEQKAAVQAEETSVQNVPPSFIVGMAHENLKMQHRLENTVNEQFKRIEHQQRVLLSMMKSMKKDINALKLQHENIQGNYCDVKTKQEVVAAKPEQDIVKPDLDEISRQYMFLFQDILTNSANMLKEFEVQTLQNKAKSEQGNPVLFFEQYYKGTDPKTGNKVYEI